MAIVLELQILHWIDKRHVVEEKQKLIRLGLVSAGDYQISTTDSGSEIEQMKNFIRLNLADLNEFLLSLEEGYREALILLNKGEIEDAKFQFSSISGEIQQKVQELEIEVNDFIEEFPLPEEKEQKFLYESYKEHWISEEQKVLKRITDINEKFKVRNQFSVYIEDILQFEVENERAIEDSDIKTMKFPYHQATQLIKFIEKPINVKIEDISAEEKQKYGPLGRKIIESCSKNQVTPNLPYLVIKFGITILEAKKILTYLHLVGMIENVYYHYKTNKEMPG